MHRRRTSNGFSPNPITNVEMQAWCWRKRITLEPFENECIDALEAHFLSTKPKAPGT